MKLKEMDTQPAMAGLPPSNREWWDLGDGYQIFIIIEKSNCVLVIDGPDKKDITLDIAEYLKVDTTTENITFGGHSNERELYLTLGIDCVLLNYTKSENYMALLEKIEAIVNENFKSKPA